MDLQPVLLLAFLFDRGIDGEPTGYDVGSLDVLTVIDRPNNFVGYNGEYYSWLSK